MKRILLVCLLLGGCAGRPAIDAQVPPFAKQPYEEFSRSAAIAVATREWRVFGSPINDSQPNADDIFEDQAAQIKPERLQGLWQRVGEYWWLGMPNGEAEQRWTGKHDAQGNEFPPQVDGRYAWSAAFISYVMRIAGAGARFPYAASHSAYINIAARHNPQYAIQAEDPALYAPVPGDLICLGRASAKAIRFTDLPAGEFPSHCDIVTDVQPGALTVIGGNVQDAVTMKHVPVTDTGMIATPDGAPVDTRYSWFVVVRVEYVVE
jgi:hypothetical protein